MRIVIGFFILGLIFGSCRLQEAKVTNTVQADTVKPVAKIDFSHLELASKKDLSCGMPLTAGLEDTAVYKGKIYGFCSKECKDEFQKDPETALAKAK